MTQHTTAPATVTAVECTTGRSLSVYVNVEHGQSPDQVAAAERLAAAAATERTAGAPVTRARALGMVRVNVTPGRDVTRYVFTVAHLSRPVSA